MAQSIPSFDEIVADFEFIDDWDERYRYIIDLGKRLEPLPEDAYAETHKVRGCASQVWILTEAQDGRVTVRGDSDAAIVKGLVALMIALFSGKTRAEIAALDADAELAALDLKDHITPQRSNGVVSMIKRLKAEAG
jgi:cysteine desulfuration protein SufE